MALRPPDYPTENPAGFQPQQGNPDLLDALLTGLTPDHLSQLDQILGIEAPPENPQPLPAESLGHRIIGSFSGAEQTPMGPPQSFLEGLAQGAVRGLGSAGTRARAERAKAEATLAERQKQVDAARQKVMDERNAARRGVAMAEIQAGLKQPKEAPKTAQQIEAEAYAGAKGRARAEKEFGTSPGSGSSDDVKMIADAIQSGNQQPDTKGLYRLAGPVRAELQRRGYDYKTANTDWLATQRSVASLNGPQQTRLRQAIDTAYSSLDLIDEYNNKLQALVPRSSWSGLNRVKLAALANQPGEAGIVARQLEAQITDVVSELGNAYMGGNSPTDHALQLAGKNLSANWSAPQLSRLVDQARKNLQIRRNSIYNATGITPGQAAPPPPRETFNPANHWGP